MLPSNLNIVFVISAMSKNQINNPPRGANKKKKKKKKKKIPIKLQVFCCV